jgi:hypothetical protein
MVSFLLVIKLKFDESSKIYDLMLNDVDSVQFVDQQKKFLENCDYENLETRLMYHLYNPETHMFILQTPDLRTRI